MTTTIPTRAAWCVYDGFTFMMHVEAENEAEARQFAANKTGLSKPLAVFIDGDTVTTFGARNTFTLIQSNGGLSMGRPEMSSTVGPISRAHFKSMVDCAMRWVDTPEATLASTNAGSDLEYVRAQLIRYKDLLTDPRWAYKSWIKIEIGRDDDREAERDRELADAYSDYLYTSSPED